MTKLLQEAFSKASDLSPDRQDAIAEWLIAELESDRIWDRLFEESQDKLEILADRALEEFRRGETEELRPDEL